MDENQISERFLSCFEMDGLQPVQESGGLRFGPTVIPVRGGIPRFTPDFRYSGNFDMLRQRHSKLQFDSENGTTDRQNTIWRRTGWTPEFVKGKLILECGCGAGPDTDILLRAGAQVVSVDLAGVDIARRNVGAPESAQFVQGSITALPLKKKFFDIVFCHRVLQHTPEPVETLRHILQFVRNDGAVFVHSYSRSFHQMFRWKYAMLPITRRMKLETLYRLIQAYSKPAFRFTNFMAKSRIGRRFNWIFVPFLNYRNLEKFRGVSDEEMIEYAIHDTFDALSPKYDKPVSAATMKKIAGEFLNQPFEVVDDKSITLLRTFADAGRHATAKKNGTY